MTSGLIDRFRIHQLIYLSEGMKLQSGISTNPKHNGGTTVMFKGRQRTFGEIAAFKDVRKIGLSRAVLLERWKAGRCTESELFAPKRPNNAKKYNIIKKGMLKKFQTLDLTQKKNPVKY